jgi:hypothetical protein
VSIKVMSAVWTTSPNRGVELLIELAFADYADDEGRCWPSVKSVSEKARCTPRYVQKTVKLLQLQRRLVIDPEPGPHGVHVYQLRTGEQSSGANSVQGELRRKQGRTPRHQGVNSETQGVNWGSPDPSIDPSLGNRQETSTRATAQIEHIEEKRNGRRTPSAPRTPGRSSRGSDAGEVAEQRLADYAARR